MFVDKVRVAVKAGDGGDGAVSFRHEKFIDRGGPDGGDGGNGGDVLLLASRNQHTLAAFRHSKQLAAESGAAGSKRKRHGKSGQDLLVDVPVGTVAVDENGNVLADLAEDGQQVVIAYGGHGGFGNAHFVSSRRQAPRVAEKGEKGDNLDVTLELKTIAEVGLVGLPNAGKSTLLASISNARPEIADYPFTTLQPNLGTVDIDEQTSLVFADIPGLIEGASKGRGLGDEFLRHVERTSVLVHLIDVYGDIKKAYSVIQKELKEYAVDLSKRPQVVVLNKIEGMPKAELAKGLKQLKALVPARTPVLAISAKNKEGVPELLYKLKDIVLKHRKKLEKAAQPEIPVLTIDNEGAWHVTKHDKTFVIAGKRIERFAARTDFDNPAGVERLRDIMRKMGIAHELERQGVEINSKIQIGEHQITW
jgi:GTP-binding protein